jgi:hypothetical protein
MKLIGKRFVLLLLLLLLLLVYVCVCAWAIMHLSLCLSLGESSREGGEGNPCVYGLHHGTPTFVPNPLLLYTVCMYVPLPSKFMPYELTLLPPLNNEHNTSTRMGVGGKVCIRMRTTPLGHVEGLSSASAPGWFNTGITVPLP